MTCKPHLTAQQANLPPCSHFGVTEAGTQVFLHPLRPPIPFSELVTQHTASSFVRLHPCVPVKHSRLASLRSKDDYWNWSFESGKYSS